MYNVSITIHSGRTIQQLYHECASNTSWLIANYKYPISYPVSTNRNNCFTAFGALVYLEVTVYFTGIFFKSGLGIADIEHLVSTIDPSLLNENYNHL